MDISIKRIRRPLFYILCAMVLSPPQFADSVYSLQLNRDVAVAAGTLSLFAASLLLPESTGVAVPIDSINPVDGSAMFPHHGGFDTASTVGSYLLLTVPAITVMDKLRDVDVLVTYGAMYAEAFLLTFSTKELLKKAVYRTRPYTYLGSVPEGDEEDYYNSFPSGHTSFAFLGATFLTTTFFHEFPTSKWRIPVAASAYGLSVGVGLARVLSGNHFIFDVLSGALLGSVYGWLIPRMHERRSEDRAAVRLIPERNGVVVEVAY